MGGSSVSSLQSAHAGWSQMRIPPGRVGRVRSAVA